VDESDITIFMIQAAVDEARDIILIPQNLIVWQIADIGEGSRIVNVCNTRESIEETMYQELVEKIDRLAEEM